MWCVGTDELILSQAQELRRGTVVLACLALLEEPQYGYALLETLGDAGIAVDGHTLYPLVRTGLLREWQALGASISRLTRGDR